MVKYEELVNFIIKNIGGKENVISLTHCVTRLRFQLKDESKANDEVLKANDGIITVMHTAGQYQIVIGNHVGDVYETILPKLGLSGEVVETKNKTSIKDKFVDLVSSIFMPAIGMLCACGMIKGLNTILSLIFTCLAIFLVFIPSVLAGRSIYLWSIITCLFIILMTLLFINNLSKKTLCACLSCIVGVSLTALLTLLMSKIMSLTGILDEQSYYLQLMDTSKPFDLKAIIFAGIILGAVGAIMDVAVELSASLLEVYEKAKNEDKNIKSLWNSGLNIGRDMMGTMSNTLVMAYIGNSISTTLLLLSYSGSLIELLNREMIIVELLQILVGSFGLLLTIPFTSIICSLIYCKKNSMGKCNE